MAWLAGWSKRIPFTIDHDDIDAALDWFPVRVHLDTSIGAIIITDVGAAAIDRPSSIANGYTFIAQENPVDTAGTIISVEIYANTNLSGCKVGIFYKTNGNTLKCRSATTIGSVTSGSKQTFAVSLPAQVGDYIGIYYSGGFLEAYYGASGTGMWYEGSDNCVVDNETAYTSRSNDILSVTVRQALPLSLTK